MWKNRNTTHTIMLCMGGADMLVLTENRSYSFSLLNSDTATNKAVLRRQRWMNTNM